MKIGIVGYKASGKTTLFEALSNSTQKYEFSEKQRIHNVKVPDERLEILTSIFSPKKTIYANIDFVDFPGFVSDRQHLNMDQNTIQKLKELDGYLVVLDGFSADRDYKTNMEGFINEIIINDLVLVEQRINALKKANNLEGEYQIMEKLYENLSNNEAVIDIDLSDAEIDTVKHYRFLSGKPCLFVVNTNEEHIAQVNEESLFFINAQIEKEITELSEDDQKEFLRDLGVDEPLKNRIIREVYRLLNLTSFLTVGSDEVRAWTIKRGSNALKAANKVHSDIAKGFIRADVISFDDFAEFKSLPLARKSGKIRSEGKDYIVKDGDIIDFKFNI